MNESRDTLEDRLQNYEARLGGLKSFVKELNARTEEHGTAREHFEEDLVEAEHNLKFYEEGIAQTRAALAKLGDAPGPGGCGTRPGTGLKSKKGIGALLIGLAAAALVAVGLKSRRGGKGDGSKDD